MIDFDLIAPHTDAELRVIADRCARFIQICGDRRGVTDANLAERIDAYRDLGPAERFRVQVMLRKYPALACTASGATFKFYPRVDAPPEALFGLTI